MGVLSKSIIVRQCGLCLWNQLPSSFRQPRFSPSVSVSVLPVHAPTTSSHYGISPLSPSITPSLFHSRLKTYTSFINLSYHRLPCSLRTDSTDFTTEPFLLSISVFFFLVSSLFLFCLFPCGRLSWLLVSFKAHVNILHCTVF